MIAEVATVWACIEIVATTLGTYVVHDIRSVFDGWSFIDDEGT